MRVSGTVGTMGTVLSRIVSHELQAFGVRKPGFFAPGAKLGGVPSVPSVSVSGMPCEKFLNVKILHLCQARCNHLDQIFVPWNDGTGMVLCGAFCRNLVVCLLILRIGTRPMVGKKCARTQRKHGFGRVWCEKICRD